MSLKAIEPTGQPHNRPILCGSPPHIRRNPGASPFADRRHSRLFYALEAGSPALPVKQQQFAPLNPIGQWEFPTAQPACFAADRVARQLTLDGAPKSCDTRRRFECANVLASDERRPRRNGAANGDGSVSACLPKGSQNEKAAGGGSTPGKQHFTPMGRQRKAAVPSTRTCSLRAKQEIANFLLLRRKERHAVANRSRGAEDATSQVNEYKRRVDLRPIPQDS